MSEATAADGSLIDNVQPDKTATDDKTAQGNDIDTSASKSNLFGKNYSEITFEDLGLEKPIAGKYKSLGELENGYKELSTKLREKSPAAPENYEIKLPETIKLPEGVDLSKDPILEKMMPKMKELGISQQAFEGLIGSYLEAELGMMPDAAKELEKLGGKDAPVLASVAAFVGRFPEAEQKQLRQIATTAEGVQLIEKIRQMTGEKSIPTDEEHRQAEGDPAELEAQAMKLKRDTPNFDANTTAIKQYEALMDRAAAIKLARAKK